MLFCVISWAILLQIRKLSLGSFLWRLAVDDCEYSMMTLVLQDLSFDNLADLAEDTHAK